MEELLRFLIDVKITWNYKDKGQNDSKFNKINKSQLKSPAIIVSPFFTAKDEYLTFTQSVSSHSTVCVFMLVNIVVFQVPFEFPDTDSSEESGGDAGLGEEGPTECNCEPGQPGFAGFAGPKVPTHFITSFSFLFPGSDEETQNHLHSLLVYWKHYTVRPEEGAVTL